VKIVAINGISGYIGTRLLARLAEMDDIERIVGIDVKPPRFSSSKLKFYHHDISRPFNEIFIENEVDSSINLAFILKPTHDKVAARQTDITGSLHFLEACRQARVGHILYLSSHTVYGAHPDNAALLGEDAPLRPLPYFQYSWDKAEVERLLVNFTGANKDVCLTVLRTCPVIGPNAAASIVTSMFRPPVMIGVAGYDPPMQFVHEDDLVEIVVIFLRQRKGGIFNVAGDGGIRYGTAARLYGKSMLRLPERLLRLLMGFSWALRLQNESPVSGLEFIKYPPLLNTEKLKSEVGFQFNYSSQEALVSFVEQLKNKDR
jgi:UDP-glucose 4-epimerase